MKLLITGICGFVGSTLAERLVKNYPGISVCGIDNLMRHGSEMNCNRLRKLGIVVVHGKIRLASDFEALPKVDWVIDAAANPSVLAGLQGSASSRQVFEHNLGSLINVLEYCKAHRAGLLLLSTSRVYSIATLCALPLHEDAKAFRLNETGVLPAGVSGQGINSSFLRTHQPRFMAAPSWRQSALHSNMVWPSTSQCGSIAAGCWPKPASSARQIRVSSPTGSMRTCGGGPANAMSLRQLNDWCNSRFGEHLPAPDPTPRAYDIPWVIMDNQEAQRDFSWNIATPIEKILQEIAALAEGNPDWLTISGL